MTLMSSPNSYGSMAIAIHWSSAAAVILMLGTGLLLARVASGSSASLLLWSHLAMGGTLLLLTLMRLVWWVIFDKHPPSPAGVGRLQASAARFVHLSFYVVIVMMVVTGLRLALAADTLPLLAAGAVLPDFSPEGITLHGLVSRILILLVCLHIGAALYHQFIRRDNLVARMLLRR